MSNLCEQLKQLRLESGRLFPKGYVLLEGLSPSLHKLAYKFADDHHELVARLERKFPKHPRDINWDKADKYAGTTLVRHCHDIVHSLKSAYAFFEDLSMFQAQALELLNRIHHSLGPISSKDGPNALVYDWMALFCDILCLHLLVQRTQKEKILQIYSAAYYAQNRQDPPHYADICALITSISDTPVQRFQQDMSHFDGRIKQILESIACPILLRFDSTLAICQSGLLSMESRNGEGSLYPLLDAELDIPKSMMLKYLMDYQSLENWVLFGVLACPGVCESAFLRCCLRKILAKAHHLHIYRDLHEPIHELFRENIYSKLTELYQEEKAKILKNSTTSYDIDADFSQTGHLVSTCHSWRDTRSDILTTKGSVTTSNNNNNKTHARRSFTWNSIKGDKAASRTCKSFGSMLTSSFSFSERSIGQSSEDPEELVAMKTMRRLDHLSSFPDDVKTRKWRAKMEIRELISVAEEEAHATAQRRHAAGCYALCNVLDNILAAAKERPDITVHALDEILTAVSLARSEIMWDIVRCSQLAIPHKKKETFYFKEKQQEGQKNKKLDNGEVSLVVGFLLERTIHVQSLLLKYRTAISHHKIQTLKRQYRDVSTKIHMVLCRLENQVDVGLGLIGHFESMEVWMKELRFPSPLNEDTEDDEEEEEEMLSRPSITPRHRAGEEFWIWDRLSDFRDAWKCVEYTFSDVESPINIGTLMNMGCEDVLFELKQTAMDVLEVGNFVETLSNLSTLKELAFYEAQVMDLILLNFKETATPESSFNVLSLLHVFSQFHKNDIWGDDPFRKSAENEFVETAERCGTLLIVRLEDFIRDVFKRITMPSGPNHQPPKTAQLFELLAYWFSTIGIFGSVEVIPDFTFSAADFLNSTIVSILRDLLLEHGLREDGRQGFRQMKKTYMDLLCFLAELQSVVEFELLSSVQNAIFGLIKPDIHNVSGSHHLLLDSLASDGEVTPYFRESVLFNEQCLVTLLADGMSTNIIRDPRNLGIIYDPRKKRFIKREADARPEKWVDVGCSVEDLRCLLSVFGIVGVQQLEIQFRSLIYQSIGKIDAYLKDHSEMLKNMTLAFSSEKELIDSPALHHLANQLRNLPALGDITLQFSRSLITRQLLSDAYALQIENSGGMECMTALQLSLPQPTEPFHDLPPSPEPIIVEIFNDLFESKQLDRWMYIPALFSCLAHEMIPNVKSFHAESGFFANGLHQIVYTLHSIALALETVYQNTYEDEHEHEANDCPTSEGFTLLFAKCLAMFTFHSKEKQNCISNTCLLLHSVCGGRLSMERLEEIGLTPTRVKSAQISAQKRHVSNLNAVPLPLTSQ